MTTAITGDVFVRLQTIYRGRGKLSCSDVADTAAVKEEKDRSIAPTAPVVGHGHPGQPLHHRPQLRATAAAAAARRAARRLPGRDHQADCGRCHRAARAARASPRRPGLLERAGGVRACSADVREPGGGRQAVLARPSQGWCHGDVLGRLRHHPSARRRRPGEDRPLAPCRSTTGPHSSPTVAARLGRRRCRRPSPVPRSRSTGSSTRPGSSPSPAGRSSPPTSSAAAQSASASTHRP